MRRYTQRSLDGLPDLRLLQELTQRLWAQQRASRWHIGELAWFRSMHHGPANAPESGLRAARWEHNGEPVAWAWIMSPGRLNSHLDPAHPEAAQAILRWFDNATDADERSATVLNTEVELVAALRRHGYRERTGGPFFMHLGRGMENLPSPQLPAGYRLRPVRGAIDAQARAMVHRAAFSIPGLPPSRVTADSYRRVMGAWPYRTDLDWLVETEHGTPVAFCLAWLDEPNRAAVLEPVGTAPDHRRRGLATAATLAALHAARRLGATSARVCARGDDDYPSARATYQSLGFRPFARNLLFARGGGPTGRRPVS
ncbi:GNAT family N-acetyltransferase [Streptomyces xiamenensis]|uniref:GNAT family N-acetyltransferase n=1 Tax=Streptomyces xiamenensis TaxID=408015 RepID=UPI0036ECB70E